MHCVNMLYPLDGFIKYKWLIVLDYRIVLMFHKFVADYVDNYSAATEFVDAYADDYYESRDDGDGDDY